ncbi:MAG: hypothetical protein AABY64_03055 [Bdellovibrionota bacterium]
MPMKLIKNSFLFLILLQTVSCSTAPISQSPAQATVAKDSVNQPQEIVQEPKLSQSEVKKQMSFSIFTNSIHQAVESQWMDLASKIRTLKMGI